MQARPLLRHSGMCFVQLSEAMFCSSLRNNTREDRVPPMQWSYD
jgi:hypothetical protein